MTENIQSAANNVVCSHPDEMTTAIVSAYVSNNSVPKGDLPDLISSVRAAITSGAAHPAIQAGPSHKASPADVKKSITPDALISFIDGKGYKTLKRHLGKHGLTPDTYRAKYGLPIDYPIVAPNYSKARSDLAKGYGLGSRNKAPTV